MFSARILLACLVPELTSPRALLGAEISAGTGVFTGRVQNIATGQFPSGGGTGHPPYG